MSVEKKVSETGDELVFHIGKRFDLDTARALLRESATLVAMGQRPHLVFDLRGTEIMETAGIGMMLLLRDRYKVETEQATILVGDNRIQQMLEIAGLQRLFTIRLSHGADSAGVAH